MTDIMPYGTEDTNPPAEPLTREEQYLSAIAGVTSSSDIPEKPLTRVEKYLNKIVENGGGGGGGGTTDYTQLSNKPQINSHELSGNKSSSDLGLQSEVLGSWTEGTETSHSTPTGTDTVLQALQKIDNNQRLDETNISSLQEKTSSMGTAGTNYITVNGIRIYVSSTAPTGDIPDGSVGLGF